MNMIVEFLLTPTHYLARAGIGSVCSGVSWFGSHVKPVVPCNRRAIPVHVKVTDSFEKSRGSSRILYGRTEGYLNPSEYETQGK